MTTHAPFAYAIALGKEDLEIRYKPTNHRGWTLIQAGKSFDSDEAFSRYNISPNVQRGCIVGAAYLFDVTSDGATFQYWFENAQFIPKPIPIKGKQTPIWQAISKEEKIAFQRAWEQVKL